MYRLKEFGLAPFSIFGSTKKSLEHSVTPRNADEIPVARTERTCQNGPRCVEGIGFEHLPSCFATFFHRENGGNGPKERFQKINCHAKKGDGEYQQRSKGRYAHLCVRIVDGHIHLSRGGRIRVNPRYGAFM